VFFGVNAASIVIDPDFYSIFPQDNERVRELQKETGIKDGIEMHLFLSVEVKGELTHEKLKLFSDVLEELENNPAVSSCISPFNFITFRKNGGRLAIELIAKDIPRTEAEASEFIDRLVSEPLAQGFVVAKGGDVLSALFVNDSDVDPAEFTEEFTRIIAPLHESFEVYFSGDLPLAAKTTSYIQNDLIVLLCLAVIVILLILFASFRSFRAVLLPILTVGIGAVWAIGFSSLFGYKLTVVSVVLPTIVIAIGSSYTVHILSEYYREFGQSGKDTDPDHEICLAVSHVMKTVLLAGLTTIIGFCSLLFTSISPIREFGLSVSFGILSCVILSLFFLPSLLSKLTPPEPKYREKIRGGIINKIIRAVNVIVVRYYALFAVVFVAAIVLAIFLYPEISRKVDYLDYFPEDDKIVSDTYTIIENAGGGQTVNITLIAPAGKDKYFLQKDVINNVVSLQDAINENGNIMSMLSFYTILEQINRVMFKREEIPEQQGLIMLLSRYFKLMGDNDITYGADAEFVNTDYSQVTFFLKVFDGATGKVIADKDIYNLIEDLKKLVNEEMPEIEADYIWGNTVLFYEAGAQIQKDQLFSTSIAMIMIVIISLIFFRSLVLGILTLIPLIFALALNYILMVVLNIPLDVTTILVSNVAIGVGVDDAIHFILQYRIQQEFQKDYKKAISSTFQITGRPIVLTTVSIVAGFSMLLFASFKPIVYFGLLVSISLTAAMISTLLFLPAFLVVYNKLKIRIKHG
jgi:hypothetical protein